MVTSQKRNVSKNRVNMIIKMYQSKLQNFTPSTTEMSSPSKRQRIGSLLQFGFTEGKYSCKAPSELPQALEFIQCETCFGLYSIDKIVHHASHCTGTADSEVKRGNFRNAFDVMKSSSAAAKQRAEAGSLCFALIYTEGKLLPMLYNDRSQAKELLDSCLNKYNLWECDSNVRKFRVNFRAAGAGCKRDIVLHMVTNVASVSADSVDKFNLPSYGKSTTLQPPGSSPPVSVAVLKSMLQKAIRRKQTLKAIRLATMLCDGNSPAQASANRGGPGSPQKTSSSSGLSVGARSASKAGSSSSSSGAGAGVIGSNNSPLSELLRRLPIICLEDAALHPALPVVVWLMIAVSKGYHPPAPLVHSVLLIVADVAGCTYRDCTPPDSTDFSVAAPSAPQPAHKSVSTPAETAQTGTSSSSSNDAKVAPSHTLGDIRCDAVRTLIACISLRASFGGMTMDMQMLDMYAQLWYERLACSAKQLDTGEAITISAGCACLHGRYVRELQDEGGMWAAQMFSNMAHHSAPSDVPATASADWPQVVSYQLQSVCATLLTARSSTSQAYSQGPPQSKSQGASAAGVMEDLSALLRLTAQDLVPEGLDQHVDFGLVPHLLDSCRDKLALYIAEAESRSRSSGSSSADGGAGVGAGLIDSIQDSSSLGTRSQYELPDSLVQDIQASIWLFRSSCNSRKLYPLLVTLAAQAAAGQRSQEKSAEVSLMGPQNPPSLWYCAETLALSRQLVEQELAGKRRRAKLWGIICPVLVAYCERKLAVLARRL